jgi:hypothetical protein
VTTGTAAPQAAENDAATIRALEALRLDWGGAYLTGHDDERGWWAARRDRIGSLMTAGTPDELRQALADDNDVRPVQTDGAAR